MVSAEKFADAGIKYLGTPYEKMDCQAFIERCMQDCGLRIDLRGSNAWYRKMDWTGSPEECVSVFGSVPTGALLFILSDDGGEVDKGYTDGKGNAEHVGIVTHTGKGAIHSSSSKGCVCESEFHNKTIRNGGWNRIGLSTLFDYGEKVNQILSGEEVEIVMEYATVKTPDGNPVKLRPTKSTSKPYIAKIPSGETLLIQSKDGEWAEVDFDGQHGYIMQKFLDFDSDEAQTGDIKITLERKTAEGLYFALQHALFGGEG